MFVSSVSGGTSAATTVRGSLARATSRNATRGDRQGRVPSSWTHASSNAANADRLPAYR